MERSAATFAGQVALVTGGAGGIGQAVVVALRARGAAVATFDRVETEADLAVVGDVADEQAVGAAVHTIQQDLGPIAFLVCAAGAVSNAPVKELEQAEWQRIIDASLVGTYLACRAVVGGMCERGHGRIVAFSSGYATKGYREGAHYAAAKAGVEAFVKSLALEVASEGVRVNAVSPGPIATPMLDGSPLAAHSRDAVVATIPMGRVGEPADVIGPVLFLLGPDSDYVTGQILHVNGGMLMP